jgi:ATP-binding cassette subfamily B multidrug efflux pump
MSPDHNEEKLIQLKDMKAIAYLLRFARAQAGSFALALGLLLASSITGIVSARLLGRLAEEALLPKRMDLAGYFALRVIILEVAAILFVYAGRRVLARSSLQSVLTIRKALFAHLQKLPMTFFDTQPQGRIVTRLTHDVDNMESFFSETMARLLNAVISLVVVFIAMIVVDWRLGLLLAASMIPAFVLTMAVRAPVRDWNREFARRNSAINAKLAEFLNGLPVIRSFGAEAWSKKEFDGVVDHHLESAIHINRLNAWSRPLISLLTSLPLALLIGLGGLAILDGNLTIAVFITFVRFCERFIQPMNVISQEIHVVQTALTNTERVATFLQQPTEDAALGPNGRVSADNLRGRIEFASVSMHYDTERPVLRDVSFVVPAGETVGLAGRTGSGKTTTLALLSRLYEFQQGAVLVDGLDVRAYDRDSLRGRIGVVSQDAVIFQGSLRENLLSGDDIPEEALSAACKRTGFEQIMSSSGLTLDSLILDQGANLSAGERQMLALTRVLVKNPGILILDEATANIDPHFEEVIHKAIDSVMDGRTCFMIAHRLDTLRNCDRIMVFRDGKLVENGTHQELSAPGSYFGQLVESSRHEASAEAPKA